MIALRCLCLPRVSGARPCAICIWRVARGGLAPARLVADGPLCDVKMETHTTPCIAIRNSISARHSRQISAFPLDIDRT